MSARPEIHEVDRIVLAVPSRARYARVVRLAVTSVASRMAFTYDEMEDLRIAVGEVCGLLLHEDEPDAAAPEPATNHPVPGDGQGPEGPRLVVSCTVDRRILVVEASSEPPRATVASELTRQILAAVVDSVELDEATGRVQLSKIRGGTSLGLP